MDHTDPNSFVQQIGLARYLQFARISDEQHATIVRTSQLDQQLRDALRPELEVVELTIRNRYAEILDALRPGLRPWLLDESLISPNMYRGYTRKIYQQLSTKAISRGEAVEALSFGFWLQLTMPRNERTIWRPYLRLLFPRGTRREQVHRRVSDAVALRNRVQHNHPVIDQDLRRSWQDILWLLDRLNPALAERRRGCSTLPRLLLH